MTLRWLVCRPILHDHAIWTVWRARAATVPHEVCRATIKPPSVRVVRFAVPVSVEMMFYTFALRFINIQVVTQWHSAGFADPGSLVLTLSSLVDEALGAWCRSLIARILPIVLLLLRQLLRSELRVVLVNLFGLFRRLNVAADVRLSNFLPLLLLSCSFISPFLLNFSLYLLR